MTDHALFGLFNIVIVIVTYITIVRAEKNKKLKFTFISGPMTTVRKVELTGRQLKFALIGLKIGTVLFLFSGLIPFFLPELWGYVLPLMMVGTLVYLVTVSVASDFISK